jgi:CRISPR-associated protein Cmr4
MFQTSKPLFFICETPLHAGSGSDLGIVDLPIQREKHTGFPKIESSSLKGAIREAVEGVFIKKAATELAQDAENETKKDAHKKAKSRKNKIVEALFGPEDANNDAHMGALGFSDARLLLFPVKSMKGVFAWVTCPKVLQQFERDMRISNTHFKITGIPNDPDDGKCFYLHKDSKVTLGNNNNHKSILLEEYAFNATLKDDLMVTDKEKDTKHQLNAWLAASLSNESFFQNKMDEDIVILSNNDFKDFVNLSTDVITRTAIDNEKGTVKPGALFTEEFLPAESVMYSLIMASPVFKKEQGDLGTADKVMASFTNVITNNLQVIQIGGGATLGKGIVRTKFI